MPDDAPGQEIARHDDDMRFSFLQHFHIAARDLVFSFYPVVGPDSYLAFFFGWLSRYFMNKRFLFYAQGGFQPKPGTYLLQFPGSLALHEKGKIEPCRVTVLVVVVIADVDATHQSTVAVADG